MNRTLLGDGVDITHAGVVELGDGGGTGAEVGAPGMVGLASITSDKWQTSGRVTTADNVTVSLLIQAGGAADPPAGAPRVVVCKV